MVLAPPQISAINTHHRVISVIGLVSYKPAVQDIASVIPAHLSPPRPPTRGVAYVGVVRAGPSPVEHRRRTDPSQPITRPHPATPRDLQNPPSKSSPPPSHPPEVRPAHTAHNRKMNVCYTPPADQPHAPLAQMHRDSALRHRHDLYRLAQARRLCRRAEPQPAFRFPGLSEDVCFTLPGPVGESCGGIGIEGRRGGSGGGREWWRVREGEWAPYSRLCWPRG